MADDAVREALRKAEQALDIMREGFEEVEVDGEMIDPFDLLAEVRRALAGKGEENLPTEGKGE